MIIGAHSKKIHCTPIFTGVQWKNQARATSLFLYQYAGIDGDDVVAISQKGIDVHLLDLGSEAEEGREAHDDFGIFLFVDALLASRSLQDFIAAQGVNHRESLAIAEWSKTGLHVLQYLDKDAAQATEHHMTETFLVFGSDEEFGALQHLLHHHARSSVNLHHSVEFQCQVLRGAYVQRHAAHIALWAKAISSSLEADTNSGTSEMPAQVSISRTV